MLVISMHANKQLVNIQNWSVKYYVYYFLLLRYDTKIVVVLFLKLNKDCNIFYHKYILLFQIFIFNSKIFADSLNLFIYLLLLLFF